MTDPNGTQVNTYIRWDRSQKDATLTQEILKLYSEIVTYKNRMDAENRNLKSQVDRLQKQLVLSETQARSETHMKVVARTQRDDVAAKNMLLVQHIKVIRASLESNDVHGAKMALSEAMCVVYSLSKECYSQYLREEVSRRLKECLDHGLAQGLVDEQTSESLCSIHEELRNSILQELE